MGQWLTPLQSDWVDGADEIEVTSPLMYRGDDGNLYIAPRYTRSNGASIPRLLWSCLGHPFQHDTRRPAVMHDHHYTLADMPRARADAIFYESMIANGCRRSKARAFYWGVRVGGWVAYLRHHR